MKIKQLFIFSLVAVSSAFLLNSCNGDKTNPAPGIDWIAEGGSITTDVTMDGDKAFTLVFNVTDDSKVKSVEIYSVFNGRKSPQFDTTISAASMKIKKSFRSLALKATEVWTIVATDDKGVSSNKSITITTITDKAGDPLISYELDNSTPKQTFKVWNFQGPNAGAFDLLDGTPRVSGDAAAEKDLHDSTTIAEISQWPGRWSSKNGTTFKKVTSYVYADIVNTGMLDAAWDASGKDFRWMVVQVGDLYIANILPKATSPVRAGGRVLLQVTLVKKTTGDNSDYIQFKFKKK